MKQMYASNSGGSVANIFCSKKSGFNFYSKNNVIDYDDSFKTVTNYCCSDSYNFTAYMLTKSSTENQ